MGKETAIAWTDHTFNPWWGCAKVSPGCEHCYAETFAKRTGNKVWGPKADRRFFGEKHWAEPVKWNANAANIGKPARVFCASMADVFEDRDDLLLERERLLKLIATTPNLDWQLLTKRPENAAAMLERAWPGWSAHPLPNVWIGATVEDQKRAIERINALFKVPARVRFLSCEPLLGPLTLGPFLGDRSMPFIDWVIVGGESGHHARPCASEWIESIVEQCRAVRCPVFVKQLGAVSVSEARTAPAKLMMDTFGTCTIPLAPNGEAWAWFAGMKDKKGGDWNEWPEDLRVREFPRRIGC